MLTFFQKCLLGTVALAALLLALVAAAKAPAQATIVSPGAQVPVAGAVPPGVITTGDATVRVRPDAAVVTIGAVVQGTTAEEAQALLSERIGKVLERTKALAITENDTKTVMYRIDPQYAYEQGKAPRLSGFQANQQIALTLHGTDGVGKALDTLVQNDGATTATVAFTLLDAKAAQASAREQAIQDARAKAQAMAKNRGRPTGQGHQRQRRRRVASDRRVQAGDPGARTPRTELRRAGADRSARGRRPRPGAVRDRIIALARRSLCVASMQEMQASKVAGEFLRGLDYPLSKPDLLRAARESNVADPIQQALAKLPDRDYEDAEDVTQALNAAN